MLPKTASKTTTITIAESGVLPMARSCTAVCNSNSGCAAWRVRLRRAVSEREIKFVRQRLQLQIDGCQYFRTYATGNRRCYLATCSFEIDVPICANAAAIWLGCVSMKKLLEPLAQ